jgi:hypothetical protein
MRMVDMDHMHAMSYASHTYAHVCMHAFVCMHAYMHLYACIHADIAEPVVLSESYALERSADKNFINSSLQTGVVLETSDISRTQAFGNYEPKSNLPRASKSFACEACVQQR